MVAASDVSAVFGSLATVVAFLAVLWVAFVARMSFCMIGGPLGRCNSPRVRAPTHHA